MLLAVALAGCAGGDDAETATDAIPTAPSALSYQAEIRRTEYGIPHIRADDWGSLGYGYGYAYAQDNFCVAMRAIVSANSRTAEFFGAGAEEGNVVADLVLRLMLGTKQEFQDRLLADAAGEALPLAAGFAAGMNRYLRETGVANLPTGDVGCRDAHWVYEIDAVDVWMHIARVSLAGSSGLAIVRNAIFAANGPDDIAMFGYDSNQRQALERALRRHAGGFGLGATGSNALAVGRELSQTGKALLLGNPHRGWSGAGGFHQLHLTVPGNYDVAGVALHGVPWVAIGFNGDLAWTHTSSFASHFTLYELQLNPRNPLQYNYEGEWRDISTEQETISVRLEDGSLEERSHTFYRSHYGPILNLAAISPLFGTWPLANGNLLSLRDANLPLDTRVVDQYLDMGRARTLEAFSEALKQIGNPLFHTLAAHRGGEVFYGEVSRIPRVTQAQLDGCLSVLGRLIANATNHAAIALDGSTTSCEWGEDADSPPGSNLYGFEARPKLTTTDYLGNGNDSYWLSNADNPLTGFPIVFGWLGHENTQQSLRTRIGHLMVRERRDATDDLHPAPGFNLASMKAFMYQNRVYAAEIVLDDVLRICAGLAGADASEARARRACAVLALWDRKVELESRGAQLFIEFWGGIHKELGSEFNQIIARRSFWAVDFDAADPLNTPRGIDRSRNRNLVVTALSDAVMTLEEAGIALDAPWREVQFAERKGNRIPIHGGDPVAGIYGAISAKLDIDAGRYIPRSGNSYLQAVTWNDDHCPVADTLLVPSQSSDPESPHHADQTELYSRKQWVRFPYCEAEIEERQIGETLVLEE